MFRNQNESSEWHSGQSDNGSVALVGSLAVDSPIVALVGSLAVDSPTVAVRARSSGQVLQDSLL